MDPENGDILRCRAVVSKECSNDSDGEHKEWWDNLGYATSLFTLFKPSDMKHCCPAKVSYLFQGASTPWGQNQADGTFQAASTGELSWKDAFCPWHAESVSFNSPTCLLFYYTRTGACLLQHWLSCHWFLR